MKGRIVLSTVVAALVVTALVAANGPGDPATAALSARVVQAPVTAKTATPVGAIAVGGKLYLVTADNGAKLPDGAVPALRCESPAAGKTAQFTASPLETRAGVEATATAIENGKLLAVRPDSPRLACTLID